MNEWLYSLRWSLPYIPCPGERELGQVTVQAGECCPASLLAQWVPGSGYAIFIDFMTLKPARSWSDERKAATRRRNLERRINRVAPLFAEELTERELAARPDYFTGK
ncbi:theronine dehydrogenase [Cronobacter sakazakii]